ncbi:MAG: hypothetical protein ACRDRG_21270 [Pseudonocardiaceae bacterium]
MEVLKGSPASSWLFTPVNEVAPPLAVPLELARHRVHGTVDYARQLGFGPAPDFEPAAWHLGPCRRPARSRSDATVFPITSPAPTTTRIGWFAP